MPEENKKNNEQEQSTPTSDFAVDALNEYKKNSVPLAKYNELEAKYNHAVRDILNGGEAKKEEAIVVPTDEEVNKLREKLFSKNSNLSNLEYAKTALELRTALIARGERDPFLPYGRKPNGELLLPTANDEEAAERVAKEMQECIDYSNGDSGLFTNELMRRTQ